MTDKMMANENQVTLFEQDDLAEIRENLRAHIEAQGKTQSDVARSLGVSVAAVSQFLAGSYAGNVARLADKVKRLLELESQRAVAPKRPGFVRTSIAQAVLDVAEYAHINGDLGLVYGDAGVGKTMALQEYARTHPDAIYISVNPTVANPTGLLRKIISALGKNEFGTRMQERDYIVDLLRGSGRLLIVDEAQHLKLQALEVLRSIHDEAGIGIVLAGNEVIYDRMHGRGEAQFAQFFSRVGVRRHLRSRISEADVRLILGPLADDVFRYMHNLANTRMGLRGMVKRYLLAAHIAAGQQRPLDVDALRAAEGLMMGSVAPVPVAS